VDDDPIEKIWVLSYANNAKSPPTLFGRVEPANAATPLSFPTINGVAPTGQPVPTPPAQAPDGKPGWMQVTYDFGGGVPTQLEMSISDLDLLVDQTVVGSARVTRNADLGASVNPSSSMRRPKSPSAMCSCLTSK